MMMPTNRLDGNDQPVPLPTAYRLPPPRVVLVPLTDAECAAFVAEDVADYAAQRAGEGSWPADEAPERAQQELLPILEREHRAAADAGHRRWTARSADGESVGWLWVTPPTAAMPADSAFLYQITVKPACRGRGYGRAMLAALEAVLAGEGIGELRLNVNDANTPARRLYASAGFELVERYAAKRQLRKHLSQRAASSDDYGSS